MGKKFFHEGLVEEITPGSDAQRSRPDGKIPYSNVPNQYTAAAKFMADAAQVTIVNEGTTNLFINGILFLPGKGIAFSGNSNEIDTTIYQIRFTGAGQNLCTVWRKVYA